MRLRHFSPWLSSCEPCDPEHILARDCIGPRRPVLSLAIEPAAGSDEDKLLEALDKVEQEDPTLQVEDDRETGQRLLKGTGGAGASGSAATLERGDNGGA